MEFSMIGLSPLVGQNYGKNNKKKFNFFYNLVSVQHQQLL